MNRQIDKVKIDPKTGEVEIGYTMVSETFEITSSMKSTEKPKIELTVALALLTEDVEIICQLPAGYCLNATIRGVSFSHKHDIMGATITAMIPVETANAPVVINTPFLPSEQYNEGGSSPVLPYATRRKLEVIISHAIDYLDGERQPSSQLEMEL